jgi:hypothetical protein
MLHLSIHLPNTFLAGEVVWLSSSTMDLRTEYYWSSNTEVSPARPVPITIAVPVFIAF